MTPGISLESRFELLQGRVSFRELCTGAYRWLRNELVVTEAARERLAAWVNSGGLTRTPDLDNPPMYGDPGVLPSVRAAFAVLPACVAELIMANTAILVSGRSTLGWTAPLPDRPRVIVLDGGRTNESITRTLLHEIAHVWVEPWDSDSPFSRVMATAAGVESGMAYARAEGFEPMLATHTRIKESRAINLAKVWEMDLPKETM